MPYLLLIINIRWVLADQTKRIVKMQIPKYFVKKHPLF